MRAGDVLPPEEGQALLDRARLNAEGGEGKHIGDSGFIIIVQFLLEKIISGLTVLFSNTLYFFPRPLRRLPRRSIQHVLVPFPRQNHHASEPVRVNLNGVTAVQLTCLTQGFYDVLLSTFFLLEILLRCPVWFWSFGFVLEDVEK